MGRIYNSTPPLSRALCPLATCPEELHPPSLSLSLSFSRKRYAPARPITRIYRGCRFARFGPGPEKMASFRITRIMYPPPLPPSRPTPFTWGIQLGGKPVIIITRGAGNRDIMLYLWQPPLSPFYYGTAVAARARRLSMQKVEFE